MKILIIGYRKQSLDWIQQLLEKKKITVTSFVISKTEFLRANHWHNMLNDCQAVIFDRVYLDFEILQAIKCISSFIIVNNLNEISSVRKELEKIQNSLFRFYFWPINMTLLADDLISIVAAKEYSNMETIRINSLEINLRNRSISLDNKRFFLKNKEFELLHYLAKNRGKVLSRSNILEQVWDMNTRVLTNTVDVHISKVRKIMRLNFGITSLIKTVPCSGYLIP